MSFVGIDVGGTFTDAVIYDELTGSIRAEKAPTTPEAPQKGLLNVIDRLNTPLNKVERLVHGMTLATNAVLERTGSSVWVITNSGFRDTLEIARTNRPVLYNIKTLKAEPLVPRNQVIEISERRLADGTVLRPVDDAEIASAIEILRAKNAEAVAVCLLHSYIDPNNERRIAETIGAALPDCFVTCSAEVLPEIREYERFATTALNAYTGPIVSRYLGTLEASVSELGYAKPVYIMASNGGVSTAGRAARLPVNTILSGPSGGVAAARAFGDVLGIRNLITYDMGGTSTDVCLLNDLIIPVTNEQFIGDFPNRTPQIAISTIGAGGGSLAVVEDGPLLRVGPESAGADPGPACYGRGGQRATVTDANLYLGRLNPNATLGGAVGLDINLAKAAIDALNREIPHLERMDLAEGIIRIAVARMVSAIKEISINEVHDPRDFVLLPYGGAGPMHAALIAEELDISRIVIPPNPGNFSALGAILSDVRHDHVRSILVPLSDENLPMLGRIFADMEEDGRALMRNDEVDAARIAVRRSCGMRYVGQSWELEIMIDPETASVAQIVEAFGNAHHERYGHSSQDPIEIVSLHVAIIGETQKPKLFDAPVHGELSEAVLETRETYLHGAWRKTPIYDRMKLPIGASFEGPALVEERSASTVVPPGWHCAAGQYGALFLAKTEDEQ
ncbi:MAG: hydantoinase/oxoprolinase family protein [Hyphomicrobiaceae bacterium]